MFWENFVKFYKEIKKIFKIIKKNLKVLEILSRFLEKLTKIWIFPDITTHCWLRRGLLPVIWKFSGVSGRGNVPPSPPLPIGDATNITISLSSHSDIKKFIYESVQVYGEGAHFRFVAFDWGQALNHLPSLQCKLLYDRCLICELHWLPEEFFAHCLWDLQFFLFLFLIHKKANSGSGSRNRLLEPPPGALALSGSVVSAGSSLWARSCSRASHTRGAWARSSRRAPSAPASVGSRCGSGSSPRFYCKCSSSVESVRTWRTTRHYDWRTVAGPRGCRQVGHPVRAQPPRRAPGARHVLLAREPAALRRRHHLARARYAPHCPPAYLHCPAQLLTLRALRNAHWRWRWVTRRRAALLCWSARRVLSPFSCSVFS